MADFIPSNDDAFDHFFFTLKEYVSVDYAALGLTTAQNTALGLDYTNWNSAWTDMLSQKAAYEAAVVSKDATRATAVALIRQINAIIQANPAVTDGQRIAAGLPVHQTHRAPLPPVETRPVLYRVDNEHLLQRLWFSDETTPGSKAKPRGAASCEIRQSIVASGGTAPTDPNTMPLLAIDTKSPHRTDFEPGDVGKTVYYAQRWIGTKGQPGPWGLVTSYLVV